MDRRRSEVNEYSTTSQRTASFYTCGITEIPRQGKIDSLYRISEDEVISVEPIRLIVRNGFGL